jgi:hypothetical protein
VTGVQTCALPISSALCSREGSKQREPVAYTKFRTHPALTQPTLTFAPNASEQCGAIIVMHPKPGGFIWLILLTLHRRISAVLGPFEVIRNEAPYSSWCVSLGGESAILAPCRSCSYVYASLVLSSTSAISSRYWVPIKFYMESLNSALNLPRATGGV